MRWLSLFVWLLLLAPAHATSAGSSLDRVETYASGLRWTVSTRARVWCVAFDENERPLLQATTTWRFEPLDRGTPLPPGKYPTTPGEWEVTCAATLAGKRVTDRVPLSVITTRPPFVSLRLKKRQERRWWRAGAPIPLSIRAMDKNGTWHSPPHLRWRSSPSSPQDVFSNEAIRLYRHGSVTVRLALPRPGTESLRRKLRLNVDATPPSIQSSEPAEGARFQANATVTLRGKVTDVGSGLQGLWWRGWPVHVRKDGSFTIRQRCRPGAALQFKLWARDKVGLTTLFLRRVSCAESGERPTSAISWRQDNALLLRLPQSWLEHPKRTDDLASLLEESLQQTNWNRFSPTPLAKGTSKLPLFGKTKFLVERRGDIKVGKWKVTLRCYRDWILLGVELEDLTIPLSVRLGFARQKPLLTASSMFFTIKLSLNNQQTPTRVSVQSFQLDLSKVKLSQLTSGVKFLEKTFAKTLRKTAREQLTQVVQDQIPKWFTRVTRKWIFEQSLRLPSLNKTAPLWKMGLKLQRLRASPDGLTAVAAFQLSRQQGRKDVNQTKPSRTTLSLPRRRWINSSVDVLIARRLVNRLLRSLWNQKWMETQWDLWRTSWTQKIPTSVPFRTLLKRSHIRLQPRTPPVLLASTHPHRLRLRWNSLDLRVALALPNSKPLLEQFRLSFDLLFSLQPGKDFERISPRLQWRSFLVESPRTRRPLSRLLARAVTVFVKRELPALFRAHLRRQYKTLVPLAFLKKFVPLHVPSLTLKPSAVDLETDFLFFAWRLQRSP